MAKARKRTAKRRTLAKAKSARRTARKPVASARRGKAKARKKIASRRKTAKPARKTARKAKQRSVSGMLSRAAETVIETVKETGALRDRMEPPGESETA